MKADREQTSDPTPDEQRATARGAELLADQMDAAGARTLAEFFAMKAEGAIDA